MAAASAAREAEAAVRGFLQRATGARPPSNLADTAALRLYLAGLEGSIAGAHADVLQFVRAQHAEVAGVLQVAEEVALDVQTLRAGLATVSPESLHAKLQAGILKVRCANCLVFCGVMRHKWSCSCLAAGIEA